jgi:HRD ubiquitin ligase complex, ER membrane component
MADRDTSGMGAGTGGPNRKDSDPMARNQNPMGQPNVTGSNSTGPNTSGQQYSAGQQGNMGRMNTNDRATSDRSATDRMTGDVSRMTDEATQAGRDSVGSAQGRIRSLLEQQGHRAADQLGSVANALHKAAEQLNEENNGTAARYADQAADRVEQVADMLRHSSVDDMVGQVERFARRQPEVFVGAAFAVGFLFARFIKSSGDRRFHGQSSSQMSSSRMSSSHMSSRYGHEDRDFGRSPTASGMNRDTGRDMNRDTGRGMAGGIAGSAPVSSATSTSTDFARQGNYATAGAAPPRASINAATAATSAARTRDAAQLMAGGSPEPTPAGRSSTTSNTPAATTPVTGVKPQGTLP